MGESVRREPPVQRLDIAVHGVTIGRTRNIGDEMELAASSTVNRRIVLIPHPGDEAEPPHPRGSVGRVPWNTGVSHKRKFLECTGRFLRDLRERDVARGTLRFWCEYEPPTVAHRLAGGQSNPKWLHRIEEWPRGSTGGVLGAGIPNDARICCQNTDPWLWQNGFTWSFCRHHSGRALRPLIRKLVAGDLILFGTPVRQTWLLDTVVLVGGNLAAPEQPALVRQRNRDPLFAAAVLDLLDTSHTPWRLIPGRQFGPETKAFSFVPALVCRGEMDKFERPDIADLLRQLRKARDQAPPKPNSRRAPTECIFHGGSEAFWELLAQRVCDAGLVLGTSFEFPITEPDAVI